jgi:TP901 family phage tail tape measure protein
MNVGELTAILKANTAQFDKAMQGSVDKMKRAGDSMKNVGKTMSMGLTLPLVGLGGAAVNAGMKFEAAMNQVSAVSGATTQQLQQMEEVARKMGATSKFSATQAAEGLNFLAMAGFSVQESMDALPATLDLASAGNMELGESADIVSNIMQGFGKQASQTGTVSDMLTATFTSANTSLSDLGVAMSYAAPTMNTFGQTIGTASSAVAALSDAGIQGSRAGTGLQQVMNKLVQDGDKLGVSMRDASGGMLPLFDILENIEKQGTDSIKIMEIFGTKAGPALLTLLQKGSKGLREFETGLADSGGTAARVSKTQMEGLKGSLTELQSALSELGIAFAKAGVTEFLEKIADATRDFVLRLSSASEGTKKFIVIIGSVLATLGPLSLAVGFLATNVMPGLIKVLSRVGAALKTLYTTMLANPFSAVAALLAIVGVAIYAYSQKQTDAEKAQQKWNEAGKEATEGLRMQSAELNILKSRLAANEKRINNVKSSMEGVAKGTAEYTAKSRILSQVEKDRSGIIDTLNTKHGEYLGKTLSTADSYTEMTTAIENANEALREQIKIKAFEAISKDIMQQAIDAQKELFELQEMGFKDYAENASMFLMEGQKKINYNREQKELQEHIDMLLDKRQKYESKVNDLYSTQTPTTPDAGGGGTGSGSEGNTVIDEASQAAAISAFQKLQDEATQLREDMQNALASGNYDMDVFDKMLDKYNTVQAKIKSINDSIESDSNPFETLLSTDKVTSAVKSAEKQLQTDLAEFDAGLNIDINPFEQAIISLDSKMKQIGETGKAFGNSFSVLDAQLAAHKSTINDLIAQGYTMQNAELQKLVATYKQLQLARQQGEGEGEGFQFTQKALDGIRAFQTGLQGASDVLRSFSQLRRSQMDAEMQKVDEQAKKEGWTAEQTAAKKEKIRKKYAKEEKKRSIAQALINTALAITSALTTVPFPLGLVMAGVAAAAGGLQVAAITAQPLAKGGIVPSGYPNDNYPALLTSGETVVPAKKLPDFGNGSFDDRRIVDAINSKQETHLNITENGLQVMSKKGNMRDTYISKKYRN